MLTRVPAEPFALDGHVPQAAWRPADVAGVAEALAEAHREGLAVVPWGGGTHQTLGNRLARYDAALSMAGLCAVRDDHPADMIITVEAGMTLAALEAHLAPRGQRVPLEAEDPVSATIGGLLSAGVAGPLRFGCGTARDFTLWIEAVRPDGTVVHGGAKVVKNVAGYDTPRLFLGSLGSLGVITAATFKLSPAPEAQAAVMLGFYQIEQAEELLTVLASGRLAPAFVSLVRGNAAWGPPFDTAPWVVVAGAEGASPTVEWQVERFLDYGREALAAGMRVAEGEDAALVRQQIMAARRHGALRLKLAVLPDQVVALLSQVEVLFDGVNVSAEPGNGIVRLSWAQPPATWREALLLAEQMGGTWVVEACPLELKAGLEVWGAPRGDRTLMIRLKQTLDPRGVLAPGRFAGG